MTSMLLLGLASLLCANTPHVQAIGLSPAKVFADRNPGATGEVEFSISRADVRSETNVQVSVRSVVVSAQDGTQVDSDLVRVQLPDAPVHMARGVSHVLVRVGISVHEAVPIGATYSVLFDVQEQVIGAPSGTSIVQAAVGEVKGMILEESTDAHQVHGSSVDETKTHQFDALNGADTALATRTTAQSATDDNALSGSSEDSPSSQEDRAHATWIGVVLGGAVFVATGLSIHFFRRRRLRSRDRVVY